MDMWVEVQAHHIHKFSLSLQYLHFLNDADTATEGQKPALDMPFSRLWSEPWVAVLPTGAQAWDTADPGALHILLTHLTRAEKGCNLLKSLVLCGHTLC